MYGPNGLDSLPESQARTGVKLLHPLKKHTFSRHTDTRCGPCSSVPRGPSRLPFPVSAQPVSQRRSVAPPTPKRARWGRPAHARRRARTQATIHVIAASLHVLCVLLSMPYLKMRVLFLSLSRSVRLPHRNQQTGSSRDSSGERPGVMLEPRLQPVCELESRLQPVCELESRLQPVRHDALLQCWWSKRLKKRGSEKFCLPGVVG
jgi:hypothetical protein